MLFALWTASIAMDVCILHFAAGTSVIITDQTKMVIYPKITSHTNTHACLQVRGNTALHMMTTFIFFAHFSPMLNNCLIFRTYIAASRLQPMAQVQPISCT